MCLEALKDTETPQQVLAEQMPVLLSRSVPQFPHRNGENFIIWKLCRSAGSERKALTTKQMPSSRERVWIKTLVKRLLPFLIVQGQVIF